MLMLQRGIDYHVSILFSIYLVFLISIPQIYISLTAIFTLF